MARNALKGLIIILVVAGAGGIGFAFYSLMQPSGIDPIVLLGSIPGLQPSQESGIVHTWFSTQQTPQGLSISDSWTDLTSLPVINFTVGSGESVYMFFSGFVYLEPKAGDFYCDANFRFKIDGVGESFPIVSTSATNYTVGIYAYVGLQNMTSYLLVGTHNITVQYYNYCGDTFNCIIRDFSLLVQTLIP
ncbi:MAG: hypothetical protein ACTSRG_00020 [Candidatus Helarchaeota archaeon]